MMNIDFRFSSIIDMLKKQAESRADQVCLLYPDQTDPHKYATLNYKQLNEVTNHVAQKFSVQVEQNSTNKTPVVCLLANSNVTYLLSIYALLKINVIVYPLSVRNSDAAIMHLLEKSNVSHLFYAEQYSSVAIKIGIKFGLAIEVLPFEEIHITELVELGESTFKPTADMNELERVRIIFHRYTREL
jgi:acyl-CoA synthetase (AMP-forming)/AMP-acid ligase II